ncbi:ribose ABC transporter ATP-binding protein [Rodentibacter pneumotropicus]|uniref:Ribose ABC transporter ATP-binding protein n=1 Tax=Rodentibacter pneumotropicus TaxID=758 RepID=A0A3S4Y3T8_9PAST|nr:ribose ABC transporter ATP-binding protein [Rodentibacter pneumotropicus]
MKHFFRQTLTTVATLAAISFTNNTLANNSFVEDAKKQVAAATAKQEKWDGPTTGPQLQQGKSIIFIASDMKNGGVLGVIDGMKEASNVAGWKFDVLDGAGTVNNQLAALNQAIAKKPDAIVIGGWNPNVAKIPLQKASKTALL